MVSPISFVQCRLIDDSVRPLFFSFVFNSSFCSRLFPDFPSVCHLSKKKTKSQRWIAQCKKKMVSHPKFAMVWLQELPCESRHLVFAICWLRPEVRDSPVRDLPFVICFAISFVIRFDLSFDFAICWHLYCLLKFAICWEWFGIRGHGTFRHRK